MSDTGGGKVAARAEPDSERDWITALQLYRTVIASHTSAREAAYSRTQIRNIVNTLVFAQELLNAQVNLALARLERA